MKHLDVLDDALIALAVCLHAHGPACVCAPCTALAQSQALLLRLADVLAFGHPPGPPQDLRRVAFVDLPQAILAIAQRCTAAAGEAKGKKGEKT